MAWASLEGSKNPHSIIVHIKTSLDPIDIPALFDPV